MGASRGENWRGSVAETCVQRPRYGRLDPTKAPTRETTPYDFMWAAGLYEGEGCVQYSGGSMSIVLGSTDHDVVQRCRDLFGGTLSPNTGTKRTAMEAAGRWKPSWVWKLYGARARGFAMSIYGLLGIRRQADIREALRGS